MNLVRVLMYTLGICLIGAVFVWFMEYLLCARGHRVLSTVTEELRAQKKKPLHVQTLCSVA